MAKTDAQTDDVQPISITTAGVLTDSQEAGIRRAMIRINDVLDAHWDPKDPEMTIYIRRQTIGSMARLDEGDVGNRFLNRLAKLYRSNGWAVEVKNGLVFSRPKPKVQASKPATPVAATTPTTTVKTEGGKAKDGSKGKEAKADKREKRDGEGKPKDEAKKAKNTSGDGKSTGKAGAS